MNVTNELRSNFVESVVIDIVHRVIETAMRLEQDGNTILNRSVQSNAQSAKLYVNMLDV